MIKFESSYNLFSFITSSVLKIFGPVLIEVRHFLLRMEYYVEFMNLVKHATRHKWDIHIVKINASESAVLS